MNERELFFILTKREEREERKVLLIKTDQGWALPAYDKPVVNNVGFEDPNLFNTWIAEIYGIEVFRRYAIDREDSDLAVFIIENRTPIDDLPPDSLFIGPDGLDAISFSRPVFCEILKSWFSGTDESQSIPWARSKGYDDAINWMVEKCNKSDIVPTGSIAQIKNAYVSNVLKCPTNKGDVYLKMLPGIFVRELEITLKLAEWNITRLPQWLAYDEDRQLILMEDMGGCNLDQGQGIDLWKTVMSTLAQFQLASIPLLATEPSTPFYQYRLPSIIDRLDSLIDEARILLRNSAYQLSEMEEVELRAKLLEWKSLCTQVSDFRIPDALDHGDLRPGNIRQVDDGLIFYDWAWSSITHPFFSSTGLLHTIRRSLPDATAAQELRDVYLEHWTDYGDIDDLRQVFNLADKLKTLYGVIIDADWVQAIQETLSWQPPNPLSADAWTLDRRQYYFAKLLRRLI